LTKRFMGDITVRFRLITQLNVQNLVRQTEGRIGAVQI